MTYFQALGFAATFTLLGLSALPGCSTSTPGGTAAGAAGKTGNDASAGAGSGGSVGQAGSVGAAGDTAAAGTTGQAGAAGHDAGADVATSDGGPSTTPDTGIDAPTSDAKDAAAEAAPMLTVAMIKATCPMYAAGTKALAPADFCTLITEVCANRINYEPLTGCFAGESGPKLWASTYNNDWTMSQRDCRSQHLCAAAAGAASSECPAAQGMAGNTCQ
ncbi:MAG TPA: hypothetical protein VGK52_16535 [Polyangia bacterium]|jgi:hypothetical protein